MNTIATLKTPPHSIDAEQAILAALMLDNSRWDAVADVLTAGDFYRKEHRILFEAMQGQISNDRPIDVVTLSEVLRGTKLLHEAGGIEYLGDLLGSNQSGANIRAYASIVRDRAVLRLMISAAHGIADSGYNPEGRTSVELLEFAEQAIFNISEGRQGETGEPELVDVGLRESIAALEYRHEHQGEIQGLKTGFADLDNELLGIADADLVIVAGRPSMGKTTFAMNVAEHTAMGGALVIVFSAP